MVVTLLVNSVRPAMITVTTAATTHGGSVAKDAKLSPTAADNPDVWRHRYITQYSIIRYDTILSDTNRY